MRSSSWLIWKNAWRTDLFNWQLAHLFGLYRRGSCGIWQGRELCDGTKHFARPAAFLPRRLIAVKRKRQIGQPDMTAATTCHAERTNLSVRTFTRRFTRCTIGYSKTLENHKHAHAVALFVWHFNFCRIHSAHGRTPAQECGLVSKTFTIEEFLKSTLWYTMTINLTIVVDCLV